MNAETQTIDWKSRADAAERVNASVIERASIAITALQQIEALCIGDGKRQTINDQNAFRFAAAKNLTIADIRTAATSALEQARNVRIPE